MVEGFVTGGFPKKPIASATVKLVGSDNSTYEIKTDSLGYYYFDSAHIKKGVSYVVSASALDVRSKSARCGWLGNPKAKIDLMTIATSSRVKQDFVLNAITCCYNTPPLFLFPNNSSSLDSTLLDSLNYVLRMMNENPDITLEISGHANYDEKDPDSLSKHRALNAAKYLADKGIETGRLAVAIYGASMPAMSRSDSRHLRYMTQDWIRQNSQTPQKAEAYARLNRRVAVSILSKNYTPGKSSLITIRLMDHKYLDSLVSSTNRGTTPPLVLFDKNSSLLKSNYKDSIDIFFRNLMEEGGVQAIDTRGSYSYDELPEIAKKRDKNVHEYILKKGYIRESADALTAIWPKKKRTKESAAKDRSVAFQVIWKNE